MLGSPRSRILVGLFSLAAAAFLALAAAPCLADDDDVPLGPDVRPCGDSGWHWDRCEDEEAVESKPPVTRKDGRFEGVRVFWIGLGINGGLAGISSLLAWASVDDSACDANGECPDSFYRDVRQRNIYFHGGAAILGGVGAPFAAWVAVRNSRRWEAPRGKMIIGSVVGSVVSWGISTAYLMTAEDSPVLSILTLGVIPTLLPTILMSVAYRVGRVDRLESGRLEGSAGGAAFSVYPVVATLGDRGNWYMGLGAAVATY